MAAALSDPRPGVPGAPATRSTACPDDPQYRVPQCPGARVSVIPLEEALSSDGICESWSCLASHSDNPRAFQQTPQWCAYKALAGDRVHLALLGDSAGRLLGVTPVQSTIFELTFSVCNRTFWTKPFHGLQMVGAQPLLPPGTDAYDALFSRPWRYVSGLRVPLHVGRPPGKLPLEISGELRGDPGLMAAVPAAEGAAAAPLGFPPVNVHGVPGEVLLEYAPQAEARG